MELDNKKAAGNISPDGSISYHLHISHRIVSPEVIYCYAVYQKKSALSASKRSYF